eukprot:Hpha_TRINITY_DN16193_c1_g9::TRINITY_DN16193_c1_g9_i1::g.3691::m.3691
MARLAVILTAFISPVLAQQLVSTCSPSDLGGTNCNIYGYQCSAPVGAPGLGLSLHWTAQDQQTFVAVRSSQTGWLAVGFPDICGKMIPMQALLAKNGAIYAYGVTKTQSVLNFTHPFGYPCQAPSGTGMSLHFRTNLGAAEFQSACINVAANVPAGYGDGDAADGDGDAAADGDGDAAADGDGD